MIGVGLTKALPTFGQQIGEKIHGNFKGDGFDDMAVGVPSENIGGNHRCWGRASIVRVIYRWSPGNCSQKSALAPE